MIEKSAFLAAVDAFKALTGVKHDKTLSFRIFGDSKRITSMRGTGDITVSRFNAAMFWLVEHWPDGHALPDGLKPYSERPSRPQEGEGKAADRLEGLGEDAA